MLFQDTKKVRTMSNTCFISTVSFLVEMKSELPKSKDKHYGTNLSENQKKEKKLTCPILILTKFLPISDYRTQGWNTERRNSSCPFKIKTYQHNPPRYLFYWMEQIKNVIWSSNIQGIHTTTSHLNILIGQGTTLWLSPFRKMVWTETTSNARSGKRCILTIGMHAIGRDIILKYFERHKYYITDIDITSNENIAVKEKLSKYKGLDSI